MSTEDLEEHRGSPDTGGTEVSESKRLPVVVSDLRDPKRRSDFDLDKFLAAMASLAADGNYTAEGYGKFFRLGTAETDHLREDLLNAKGVEIEVRTGVRDRGENRTSVQVWIWENNGSGMHYTLRFEEDGTYFSSSGGSYFQESQTPPLPKPDKEQLEA